MSKTKKIYKNKKYKKRKYGGNSDIQVIPIADFDPKKSYASKELGLKRIHAISLHHNKFNLSIVANLNIDLKIGKTSMYFDKNKDPSIYILNILKKYGINAFTNKENELLRQYILVGEGTNKTSTVPIFLSDDETGHFYDMNGVKYIPTYNKTVSSVLNKVVYLFVLPEQYKNENIDEHSEEIASNLQNGESISNFHMLQTVGIDDSEELKPFIYKFDRIRITPEQKETISTTFLDYKILYSLNYDDSKGPNGNHLYKSNERLSFFSYEKIKKACSSWYSFTPDEQFKKCLLVGFTVPYNNIRRAVYMKANGFFSDGYADYYPTFETIKVTQKDISALFKSDKLDDSMNFLVGKVAYEFSYGTETIWNVTYNQEFRDKLYDMYVWGPIKTCAVGLVIALIFAALPMVWGTAFVLPNVGTTLLTSLTVSTSLKTGVASVDYIKNNKVKSKDEWKEGGVTFKKKRGRKSQKRKQLVKLFNNKSKKKNKRNI